jgi:hypothetical protein
MASSSPKVIHEQASPFVKQTLRTIVIGLLIDILAFTMILPLLPRLLESYHTQSEKVCFFYKKKSL